MLGIVFDLDCTSLDISEFCTLNVTRADVEVQDLLILYVDVEVGIRAYYTARTVVTPQ